MKRLLSAFVILLLIASCKKQTLNEPKSVYAAVDASGDVGPVNQYVWTALTGVNAEGISNTIIPVNGMIFCRTDILKEYDYYKLNNTTKQWEYFNDFSIASSRMQYLFSFQNKMFFGIGMGANELGNSMFSVDATTGAKAELADFPGTLVSGALTFILGNKAYLIGGVTLNGTGINQYWEYDFLTDTWTNKGSSPLGNRWNASYLTIDDKVYIGLGVESIFLNGQRTLRYKNDWIQFTPSSVYHIIRANFPGQKRQAAKGFVLQDAGYLGFGNDGENHFADFWKYNPSNNTWVQQTSWPGNLNNGHADIGAFSLGNAGYVVKGGLEQFWRFSLSAFVPGN